MRLSVDPATSTSLIHDKVSSGVDVLMRASVLKLTHLHLSSGSGNFPKGSSEIAYLGVFLSHNPESKFLQYDAYNSRRQRFLVQRGVGVVELGGSRVNISPCLVAVLGKDGCFFLEQVVFQKHFLKHPFSGTRNSRWLIGNVGHSCSLSPDRKCLSLRSTHSLCLAESGSETRADSSCLTSPVVCMM